MPTTATTCTRTRRPSWRNTSLRSKPNPTEPLGQRAGSELPDRPLFRITDHSAGPAMVVYLPAQRPTVHADALRCTWMYETRNETAVQPGPRAAVPGLIFPARLCAWLCQPVLMPAPRFGVTDRPGDIVDHSGRWLAEQLDWRWIKTRRDVEVRAGRQVHRVGLHPSKWSRAGVATWVSTRVILELCRPGG